MRLKAVKDKEEKGCSCSSGSETGEGLSLEACCLVAVLNGLGTTGASYRLVVTIRLSQKAVGARSLAIQQGMAEEGDPCLHQCRLKRVVSLSLAIQQCMA